MDAIRDADRISLDDTFEYGAVILVRPCDPLAEQSTGYVSKCGPLFAPSSTTVENLLLFPDIRVRNDEERRREILVAAGSTYFANGEIEGVRCSLRESFRLRSCCMRYGDVGMVLSSRIRVRLIGRSAIGDSV